LMASAVAYHPLDLGPCSSNTAVGLVYMYIGR
jgi:hypothetical protein